VLDELKAKLTELLNLNSSNYTSRLFSEARNY